MHACACIPCISDACMCTVCTVLCVVSVYCGTMVLCTVELYECMMSSSVLHSMACQCTQCSSGWSIMVTVAQSHSTTVLQYHSTTVPQYYSTTVHSYTVPQYHIHSTQLHSTTVHTVHIHSTQYSTVLQCDMMYVVVYVVVCSIETCLHVLYIMSS